MVTQDPYYASVKENLASVKACNLSASLHLYIAMCGMDVASLHLYVAMCGMTIDLGHAWALAIPYPRSELHAFMITVDSIT